jgi:lysozyme
VVELVAAFEGFQPRAYLCPGRVWTIGYGTTRWADGRRVATGDGPIDEAAARRLLARDLADAAEAVDALVDVPLAEGERAALISFVHNLGRGAFSASTLLQKLNLGQRDGAAGEFARWNRGGGRVLPGLIRRRAAEAALFGGGDWRRVARVG